MKIPIEWLKEFVDIKVRPEELAERLTMSGLETTVAEKSLLDVDVLPNHGDCSSVLGVAREISAITRSKLKRPKYKVVESAEKTSSVFKVEVKDKKLCPRYMTRLIENVTVKESPDWMKDRLVSAGMRPINNIVDITNYLLLELGQPMHVFDASLISGNKIIVRCAMPGETLITLDGIEKKLEKEMLVIADENLPIALAGVMGGAKTEVSSATASVLLESAYFDPISINKTSKTVKLRTEASIRFEKGVDWMMVEEALDRAAVMIAELSGGNILKGKIDVCGKKYKTRTLNLRPERIHNILGITIKIPEIIKILKSLGFSGFKINGKKIKVNVPSWRRADIEREIDLIEEIARIYGYGRIKTTLPKVREEIVEFKEDFRGKVKEILLGSGFYETQTFSLVDPKMAEPKAVKIINPLTPEESVMRTSLLPSLMKVVSHNIRHQINDVKIFEIGKIFLPSDGKLPIEKWVVSGMTAGNDIDYYKLKNIIENLIGEFTDDYRLESVSDDNFHPGKSAAILIGPKPEVLGKFGAMHPDYGGIYAFELELNALFKCLKPKKMFKPLPKFPKVDRDLAMFVPEGASSKSIVGLIRAQAADIIEDVYLFDRYKNSQAYRISFRDRSGTLTDEIINPLFVKIQNELAEKLKVEIRK